MDKVCHSVFVDPRYGCDCTGQLNNPAHKFATINRAIYEVRSTRKPTATSQWTVFLSPCNFEENVHLYPFINLQGEERIGSTIIGNIYSNHLTQTTDLVELSGLTIQGQVFTELTTLGTISLFNLNLAIFNRTFCFSFEAGEIKLDSCLIQQTIAARTTANYQFYCLSTTGVVNLNVRNCRHERYFLQATIPNQTFSNILSTNINISTIINCQTSLFANNFTQLFLGLLIPYDTQFAAGFLQSHSDTLRHAFANGAGNGVSSPVVGQTYSTAFILVRKIKAANSQLEVHIHTPEVLGLPETTLNTFSSAHTVSSGTAKTKHVGWQGFKQIPEALRILDVTASNLAITVTTPNAERSMTGNASDGKLFAGRLALEILTIVNIPFTPGQAPTVPIPDNVGLVNVQQAPVILQIPFGPNLTLGQQITFVFEVPGFVLISTVPDPANPPAPGTSALLSDVNLTGQFSSIAYNVLPIKPSPNVFPPNTGAVEGISSVTFTLIAIGGSPNNISYFWRGASVPSKNNIYTPGNHSIPVPAQATTMFITAWAGGGAGGKNDKSFNPFNGGARDVGGGGGGGGAAFTLTQSVSGFSSITVDVGAGSKSAGKAGANTEVDFGTFKVIAGGGGAGANGNVNNNTAVAGGSGGLVTIFNGTTPLPSLPGLTIINGVNGGGSGLLVPSDSENTGQQGSTSATGYLGGHGGTLNANVLAAPLLSGPGGGAGGFNGYGATAGSFYLIVGEVWGTTKSGSSAAPISGAGGAGEGPNSISNIANGGDGGAIVYFS